MGGWQAADAAVTSDILDASKLHYVMGRAQLIKTTDYVKSHAIISMKGPSLTKMSIANLLGQKFCLTLFTSSHQSLICTFTYSKKLENEVMLFI